jgi:tryptophan synthase alpha chain
MSDRIAQTFAAARAAGRTVLCPFFTAGYPTQTHTADFLLAAQRGGAGVIELGIPFSDPVADGPVIQASYYQALAGGTTVQNALAAVADARSRGLTIPVVAMVSFSIVFKRGANAFAQAAAASGCDGVILPDVPLEEAPAIVAAFSAHHLASSLLVAPTTPPERRAKIATLSTGFVYYLSVSGVTGERRALPQDIVPNLEQLRSLTPLPICVGFGISTPAQVGEVTKHADGAIIGSAIVRRIQEHLDRPETLTAEVEKFVAELAGGLSKR